MTLMNELESLLKSYVNEKGTKHLLKYNTVVDKLNEKIKKCEVNETEVTRIVQEMERERIKYFVKEYILVRLQKICGNLFLDTNNPNMSHKEQAYYRRYIEIMKEEDIIGDQRSIRDEFVGFFCEKEIKNIKIDEEYVEMYEGDFFVAKFDDVKDYLDSGHLSLV